MAVSAKVQNLLKNSGLPGPRGNLELLYSFSREASESDVKECFSFYSDDLSNSPEEFVVMCGITGYCVSNRKNIKKTIGYIRGYASHSSWRIREAVAIGIQEIAEGNMDEIISNLMNWIDGNDYEKRAVIAALCEPKLLKQEQTVVTLFKILDKITMDFKSIEGKLSDSQNTLRKTLGYGWSVAIAALPVEGKKAFSRIAESDNKQIKWIVRENLKKNRLAKMDRVWVEKMTARYTG